MKDRYNLLRQEIPQHVKILAATKQREKHDIIKLIQLGQRVFGENKVQDAIEKWPSIKAEYPDIKLHMIGHLQSNKIKDALQIFDVIETLDSYKLAERIASLCTNKKVDLMIQVNIGRELQKHGVMPEEVDTFVAYCREQLNLNIVGLMCIPPKSCSAKEFFSQMQILAFKSNISELSMGMTSDYKDAIDYGSTEVRLGRFLFENIYGFQGIN